MGEMLSSVDTTCICISFLTLNLSIFFANGFSMNVNITISTMVLLKFP